MDIPVNVCVNSILHSTFKRDKVSNKKLNDLTLKATISYFLIFVRVEFSQLAADYKVVNLGQGFPDFSPPGFILEAFCKAVNGGVPMHQYTRAFVRELNYIQVCLLLACKL